MYLWFGSLIASLFVFHFLGAICLQSINDELLQFDYSPKRNETNSNSIKEQRLGRSNQLKRASVDLIRRFLQLLAGWL